MLVVAFVHVDKNLSLGETHFPGIRKRPVKKGVKLSSGMHGAMLAWGLSCRYEMHIYYSTLKSLARGQILIVRS